MPIHRSRHWRRLGHMGHRASPFASTVLLCLVAVAVAVTVAGCAESVAIDMRLALDGECAAEDISLEDALSIGLFAIGDDDDIVDSDCESVEEEPDRTLAALPDLMNENGVRLTDLPTDRPISVVLVVWSLDEVGGGCPLFIEGMEPRVQAEVEVELPANADEVVLELDCEQF